MKSYLLYSVLSFFTGKGSQQTTLILVPKGEEGQVPPPLKKTFIRNVFSVSPALNNGVLKTLSFFRILNFGKEDIFEFKVPVSSL